MKYLVAVLMMATLFFGGILVGMEKEDVQQAAQPGTLHPQQQDGRLTASAALGSTEEAPVMERTAPVSDEGAGNSVIQQLAIGIGSVFTGICSIIITAIEQLSSALFG